MEFLLNKIRLLINLILEILFPSACMGCETKGEILCSSCIINLPRCEREAERNIIAVFDYQTPLIKKVIWNLKYYHHPNLGKRLGEILYEELLEDISDLKSYSQGKPIIIIPVPISKTRIKTRGYNQARKIAYGFCNSGNKKNFIIKDNIIFKKINTPPQAKINNRERRLKNIRGAFGIKNEKTIKGQTIIVIDDVTTTGGTITEIMKVLENSGVKRVIGLAIAH